MMLLYFIAVLQLLSLTGASESGVVGGKESKPHSRPYMAELQVRGHHVCGGILIRKDFVLTSAHCKQKEDLMVVLGAHNRTKDEKSQQKISVAEYIPHPKYYDGKCKNDIMLLKLKTNAKLTKNVKPIQLPKWNQKIHANTPCLVAGWGRTNPRSGSPASDVLRETTVKMQAGAECKRIWQDYFSTDQMICTHTDGNKAGICQGDSGGPLICAGKLHGITAFTIDGRCDDPGYPHVFIKVPFFSQWIKTEMKG